MSLSVLEAAKQLSPSEMDVVTEQALHSGSFTIESVEYDGETHSKNVTVEFKSGRREVIKVSIWKTNSL